MPYGDPLDGVVVGSVGTGIGTGGATTKVAAARHAADAGTGVLLTSTSQVDKALRGEHVGTWFSAQAHGRRRPGLTPAPVAGVDLTRVAGSSAVYPPIRSGRAAAPAIRAHAAVSPI